MRSETALHHVMRDCKCRVFIFHKLSVIPEDQIGNVFNSGGPPLYEQKYGICHWNYSKDLPQGRKVRLFEHLLYRLYSEGLPTFMNGTFLSPIYKSRPCPRIHMVWVMRWRSHFISIHQFISIDGSSKCTRKRKMYFKKALNRKQHQGKHLN